MQGHELVELLFSYAPPKNQNVADLLGEFRDEFKKLGHLVVNNTAITPEQTIFIRKMHEALQAAIYSVVLHQEGIN